MEDAKGDGMSIATITENSGKPWMHLVNECGYYILKIKQMMWTFVLSSELILSQSCHYHNEKKETLK